MELTKTYSSLRQKLGQRMHGRLARALAIDIVTGQLPVGYNFPGEIEMSENLGISRTALREAFRILSAKGLVESRPKAGTRVSSKDRWSVLDPELLAWQFETEPTLAFISDLFELRMVIEPAVAELAASRCSQDDLDVMREALDGMRRHGLGTEEGRLADEQFHVALLRSTRNSMIMGLAGSIMAAIAWTTVFKARTFGEPRDPIDEHERLYQAVASRDEKAAREAMAELVRLALQDTKLALSVRE